MRIKEGFLLREVASNYVVISTGEDSLNFDNVVTINEIGAFIWKKIEDKKTEDEIVDDILAEYAIDKETAKKDCKEFIDRLREINIITD